MSDIQEPILAENNQDVNTFEQIENSQNQDVVLQTEETIPSEVKKKRVRKTSGSRSAKKEKSVEKKEESTSNEVLKQTEIDAVSNELSEKKEIESEVSEETEEMIEGIADDFFDHLNRQEVVETLEEIVSENDIVKVKKQISLLKIRFLQLNKENREEQLQSFLANGGNKEDYDNSADELEVRFEAAFDRYKANKAKYTENLEQSKVANLEKKRALLEELKLLIESSTDSLKQIYDKFKDIQTIWKEIGPVPQANVTELWQNYHFYVEKFFDKVKINRELRELDFKKNLERKLEICEKTEALLLETSIIRAFNLLQQYHHEWKESGPIEEDKKAELWVRFKTASDKINQNRKDYYDELGKLQEENYKAKLILCDKLEEILQIEFNSAKQVSKLGDEVTRLLETWKSLGPAPKAVQDEIWKRFRKSLDTFFANKKQYASQIKEEQLNNYNLKLNLCIQAEALALRTDWVNATKEVIELQQEWQKIGQIERRKSETLWKRFHKACESYFATKKEYIKNIRKYEQENLRKKEGLIKRIQEYVFVGSRDDDFDALKAFQREWTAIGYIPMSEKERLLNNYRKAIEKRLDELKISPYELDKAKYTEHLQGMLNNKNKNAQNDVLAKEQRFLQQKIKQLTNDAILWENNLGFFAHSKNSDELRTQFNKKIEHAKQEIESLKTKLAILRKESGDKK
jgi:hypothetical protein